MKYNQSKQQSTLRIISSILGLPCIVLLIAFFLSGIGKPETITYDQLISKVEAGEVEAIYVSTYSAKVKYTEAAGSKYTLDQFKANTKRCDATLRIGYRTDVVDRIYAIAEANPALKVPSIIFDDPTEGNWLATALPIVVMLGFGVLLFFIFRQSQSSNNKAMQFGKTKARLNQNTKVKFSDVAGADEEKEELQEIVDFLKNPKKFSEVGARIPKGVLLVGPPGTGKTLFAKAVAGEANVPFFSISGSDFVEMFVGVGASRVRDLFAQAKANMPCIIFIDEIDAVGRQRGAGLGGGNDEREQTLNQLLVQMDGFETNEGIIIMAATNRVDILDPALMRPGRFDRQIYVNIPDVKGREAIFKVHARNKTFAGDINFKQLARLTSGFTGADIENLLNESAILAARDNRKVIIMKDILEGINKVIIGPQKKSRIITESDKRITAYHESGHAIVAYTLENCDEVQEVSIIPRGLAAGYTLTLPDNDNSHMTKNTLNDMIAMMLGGRAAEEIVIQDISTGASNDIQRATGAAKSMVTEWGMSSALGNSFWGSSREVFLGRDYQAQHSYSEEIAGIIDEETRAIIDANYLRAKDIITRSRSVMDNMVKLLYERETIYASEVQMLFAGKTAAEILAKLEQEENAAKKPDYIVEGDGQAPTNNASPDTVDTDITSDGSDSADTATKAETTPVDASTEASEEAASQAPKDGKDE